MKLTKTTVHDITFSVEAFWDEEGGMGHECMVSGLQTLAEAVEAYERACLTRSDLTWIIAADVSTKVSA